MKKVVIILSLLLTMGLSNTTSAQNINVYINIDRQPAWGPIGYDYVEFYYFPDINIYYDIVNSLFYYPSRRAWIASEYLPYKYRVYDLYGMYKVIINDVPRPWLYNRTHKRQYAMYKGDRNQIAIRYSSQSKYNRSRESDRYWVDPNYRPSSRPTTNNSTDRRTTGGSSVSQPNNQNRPSQSRPNDRPNRSGSSSSEQSSGRR